MIFLLICLLLPVPVLSQPSKPWPDYRFPAVIADNSLWIGTPTGLYQYHVEEDSWSLYGKHNGLPDNHILMLRWDGDYLWVITPEGLAQGDTRLNKWLGFNRENGLPDSRALCMEFQEDYVWIGTKNGAARYDKLIQEWETFDTGSGLPDTLVYDIAVNEDLVYFATAHGLAEYDINFEKWRYFTQSQGLPSDTIRFIYQTTEDLWLFTPRGPCQFNKSRYTILPFLSDPRLKFDRIHAFVPDNNRFWVATDSSILIYDTNSTAWRDYQEASNLPSQVVNGFTISQESNWFATEKGVARQDESTKSWQTYDWTHGLTAEVYDRVMVYGGRVFLINENTIDYLKMAENRWYTHPVRAAGTQSGQSFPVISLDRENGSYAQINPDVRLDLNGTRITSVSKWQHSTETGTGHTVSEWEHGNRMDVKGQLTLGQDRTLNAFYNNVDETQVIYGIRYRGRADDLIREIQWGDIRFEKGRQKLLTSTDIFGGAFRMEAGPRTEQYKRSLFSLKGGGGERTTASEMEFLTGNLKSGHMVKYDVDYVKNRFFALAIPDMPSGFNAGDEIIYLDDASPGTDDKNTMHGVLAEIEGDYDRLFPVIDYTVENGIVRLLRPVGDHMTLIAVLPEGPAAGEYILQHENHSTVLNNFYQLGVQDIVPHSFHLSISDTLGLTANLEVFGLDTNHDGIVDPEYIDYQQGILQFPASVPFPDIFLDPAVSVYRMSYDFQTELNFFILKHDSLKRGSEILTLDGEILTPGQDYVLDYTVGTLIIIKEGILAEDSEIQIEYEYHKNTDKQLHWAGVGFSPSDRMMIEATGYAFDTETGGQEQTQGVNFYGEFRTRISTWNLKLTPEFNRSQTGDRGGNHAYIRSDLSSSRFRLYGLMEHVDMNHRALLNKQFRLGNLRDKRETGFTIYPVQGLDLSGLWQKILAQTTESGYGNSEENAQGKILFSRPSVPAIAFTVRKQTLDTEYNSTGKWNLRGEMDYIVPPPVLNRLSVESLRIYAVLRQSREKMSEKITGLHDATLYDNAYFRLDLSPVSRIQLNGYFRHLRSTAAEQNFDPVQMLNQHDKIFLDAVVDRITGMNINMRYQGDIHESVPSDFGRMHQFTLGRRLESSLRIFPGQWWKPLTSFIFQISIQPFWQGTLRNVNRQPGWTDRMWPTLNDETTSSTDNHLIQYRGEWRPLPGLLIDTRHDRQDIRTSGHQSLLNTRIRRLNEKIEFRPVLNMLITLQYFRTMEEKAGLSKTIRNNPMMWIEKRWNAHLLTKMNFTVWQEERRIGKLTENTLTVSPLVGLTYRFFKKNSGSAAGEIRNDFSTSFYRRRSWTSKQVQNVFENNCSVDLYPASIFIVRARWTISYTDRPEADTDIRNNTVEIRLTAQF
ncbi:hypothetical protein JW948_12965 [bacterium]|nr:hypothetical protein [bacterium]